MKKKKKDLAIKASTHENDCDDDEHVEVALLFRKLNDYLFDERRYDRST